MIPLRSLILSPILFLVSACTTASGTFAPLEEDHPASAEAAEVPITDPAAFLRVDDASPVEEPGASAASPSTAPTGAYVCPMHPEVTSDEPGTCAKCGMQLVLRESAEQPDDEHSHDD